jgi:hypothetical protein
MIMRISQVGLWILSFALLLLAQGVTLQVEQITDSPIVHSDNPLA